MAIGGLCAMLTWAASTVVGPAHAQAMQVSGFNEFDPQWALASSHMSSGFNADYGMAAGLNQQAYTAKLGSGTVGIFFESGSGAGTFGGSGGPFGSPLFSPTRYGQNWFAQVGNPVWSTSTFSYKSDPNTALVNGLYTTASFGVTSFKTDPAGFSGLPSFSDANGVAAMTARAGLGLQLTPQISIEGSVGWTQTQGSAFR